jgi:hypothetical protein
VSSESMSGSEQLGFLVSKDSRDKLSTYPYDANTRRQGKYVAIMGTLKTFGGKRHVSATHIRPLENHDELFTHLLRALHVSLSFRMPAGGGGGVSVHLSDGRRHISSGWG